jgi:glycerate 2-kinase
LNEVYLKNLCGNVGGGSALLPMPIPPISLSELMQLTSLISRKGATITELNIIRKQLEILKGGGLARLAYPAKVSTTNNTK